MEEKEKESVRIVACPEPFSTVRVDKIVPAGETLAEIIKNLGVRLETATDARVLVGDGEVRRSHWPNVRPKPGSVVTIRVVPRGGDGKSFLRIIIGIAGAALGAFTGGTSLIPTSILGVSGINIGTAIGGLIAFTISNALIPPPKQPKPLNLGIESSPSVSGAGNRIAQYEPFQKIFGRHRVIPPQ